MSGGSNGPGLPGHDEIIHDWNTYELPLKPAQPFDLNDETLRDGVQSPSVVDPDIDSKLELLELMHALGIRAADIGLPGAGKRAFDDVVRQARYIDAHHLAIEPNCAARTVIADVKAVVEAAQKSGKKIVVYTFIGSSPIRQWAEGWALDFIEKQSAEAIAFAVGEGLECAYVTEDTTRSSPRALETLLQSAIDNGASRLVLCDTVGHATPAGAKALVGWVRRLVGRTPVKLDWHGHNDRGMAVANAIAALEAGVNRVHACGLGVGERVGNTSMDQLLLNLKLLGWYEHDLSKLVDYVELVSKATKVPIPVNYPLSGGDAFRTATGVHASAIIKAMNKGDAWLADRVYSGVPAGEFGREQVIEVGHMSGMSNVRYWLEKRKLPVTEEVCQAVLKRAKACAWTLSEKEILAEVKKVAPKAAAPRAVKARGKTARKHPARGRQRSAR